MEQKDPATQINDTNYEDLTEKRMNDYHFCQISHAYFRIYHLHRLHR